MSRATGQPEERRAVCTYDCPDACSLLVSGQGETLTLRGDPDHPITAGMLCHRIRRHPGRLRDPERLRQPMLRQGDDWTAVSWQEALKLAGKKLAAALQDHGPASVVWLGGGGSLGLSKQLIGHFFHSLGPITTRSGGVCGAAGDAAQALDFGGVGGHDYSDMDHSDAVVLWGKDPATTGLHLLPFVRAARRRGAPVTLIEVRPTKTAHLVDRVIRIRPGGDGWLALAVLRWLRGRDALPDGARARVGNLAGIEPLLTDDVADAARRAGASMADVAWLGAIYARRAPVGTWVGWGPTRRRFGGRNLRWIDALGVLSGHVGVRGGGINFNSDRRRGLDTTMLARRSGRVIAAPFLAEQLSSLTDPPARFAWIATTNPVTQYPDSAALHQALRGVDFTVVADAFMTDTARAADLVLPVKLMLEEADVVGSYQHQHIAAGEVAATPMKGPRSDVHILRSLRAEIGLPPDPLLEDVPATLARMTRSWFDSGNDGPKRNPCQPMVPWADGFDTADGLAHLVDELPAVPAHDGDFPLLLQTPPSHRWQTSQLTAREQDAPPTCFIHPEAAPPGVRDGDPARLVSPIGELTVGIALDEDLWPGGCVVHRGGALALGRCVNRLVQAHSTDIGLGAAFYDQPVRLEVGSAQSRSESS